MEYTINFMIWSLLGLLLVLLELGHPGLLLFLAIAIGAFSAAGATFMTPELGWQLAVFIVTATLGIILTQLWLRRLSRFFSKSLGQTNVYALIGKRGVVLAELGEQQTGYVKIDGEVWLAKTVAEKIINPGQEVLVTGTKGCHVIVKVWE
ncbi:MAG TPA: NfeD family protein [Candidatus Babeliales bacterium]|nr:NfeD family protein [Candidatus Babeliales bacterium]